MNPHDAERDRNGPEAEARDLDEARAYLGEGPAGGEDPGGPPRDAEPDPPRPLQENNLLHDAFDRRLYTEITEASEQLAALSASDEALETFPALLEDFFYAFFKVKPRFAEKPDVEPGHARVNRPFLERLLEDERTAILRISTATDDMASALGALEAGTRVLEELRDRPDLASWVERAADPTADSTGDQDQQENPPGPPSRDLRRSVRAALDSAREAVDDHSQTLAGWGLSPADLKKVPLSGRLEVARKLNTPRMGRFAALLGRMRRLALSEAGKRLATGVDEVHSVTTGGPIQRVLPQELASGLSSSSRVLRLDFYRKMVEGSLFSYELKGTESSSRGPVVALIDASSSMAGPPMDWATAMAAALAQGPAARDNRHVHLVYFNTAIVAEIELLPGERDPNKLLQAATTGASGGTDYDTPLRRALQIVQRDERHRQSDLVLVTDGRCRLSPEGCSELSGARESLGLSLHAVLCGPHADAGDVARYATTVRHAEKDLTGAASRNGERIAGDLFGNL